jgi:predicted nucleotide-binding protein
MLDTDELVTKLQSYRDRVTGEVLQAYSIRGASYGAERFNAWRRKLVQFLDEHLPGESIRLINKLEHFAFTILAQESDAQRFWREDGETAVSFIDSLIVDLQTGEYISNTNISETENMSTNLNLNNTDGSNRIFIVHGHGDLVKVQTARFLEKLGFEAIILHEQASRGSTIIEKIEKYTNVGFAIVLYTPDDKGNSEAEADAGQLNHRARQNVVFEHGYLIAKLGRDRVVPLVNGRIELPGDISGIIYVTDKDWQIDLAKEMKSAGYDIDFNKLL